MEELKRRIEKIEEKIREHEERISKLEKSPPLETIAEPSLEKFSKFVQLPEEIVKKIFDFDFSELKLTPIKPIGANAKEKTQNIVLVALLAYKYVFGKTEILAAELRRIVVENGLPANFSPRINEIIPSLIRRKGALKSPKTSYKLTAVGEMKAKEIVKKMAEL